NVTSSVSTGRGSPVRRIRASSPGSEGRPRALAKSLPRPAGTRPSVAPVPLRAPPTHPVMPSPPTASTTRPCSPAARASSPAWARLRLYSVRRSAPASRSSRARVISAAAPVEPPAVGLTTAVNWRIGLPPAGRGVGWAGRGPAGCRSLTGGQERGGGAGGAPGGGVGGGGDGAHGAAAGGRGGGGGGAGSGGVPLTHRRAGARRGSAVRRGRGAASRRPVPARRRGRSPGGT